MEVKKASPSAPGIKWALIGVITSIIITYAFKFLNIDPNSGLKWISFIPFIAFLCLTQKEYRDQLGGYLTFGEGFISGFLYAVFVGVLGAIFTYLYLAVLSPEVINKILEASEAEFNAQGLSPEQVEQRMSMTQKFVTPVVLTIFSLILTLIIGVIGALIGAAIFKKERSPFDTPGYDEPQPLDSTV